MLHRWQGFACEVVEGMLSFLSSCWAFVEHAHEPIQGVSGVIIWVLRLTTDPSHDSLYIRGKSISRLTTDFAGPMGPGAMGPGPQMDIIIIFYKDTIFRKQFFWKNRPFIRPPRPETRTKMTAIGFSIVTSFSQTWAKHVHFFNRLCNFLQKVTFSIF